MNPTDKAKEIMNQVIKKEVIPPIQNLINEAKTKNAVGPINVRPNTYERIRIILKDGGMDSSSVDKSIERIKEVLSK